MQEELLQKVEIGATRPRFMPLSRINSRCCVSHRLCCCRVGWRPDEKVIPEQAFRSHKQDFAFANKFYVCSMGNRNILKVFLKNKTTQKCEKENGSCIGILVYSQKCIPIYDSNFGIKKRKTRARIRKQFCYYASFAIRGNLVLDYEMRFQYYEILF